MIALYPVASAALPRNREMRARLMPHLDADPELLTALLIHLELARDDRGPRPGRRAPRAIQVRPA